MWAKSSQFKRKELSSSRPQQSEVEQNALLLNLLGWNLSDPQWKKINLLKHERGPPKGQIKPKAGLAQRRSSQKMNEQICFVCCEKQKRKQNKFAWSFFGRIYRAPICFLFYLTFKSSKSPWIKIPLIRSQYVNPSKIFFSSTVKLILHSCHL